VPGNTGTHRPGYKVLRCQVGWRVAIPGRQPYDVVRRVEGRREIALHQPGLTVAVRVDPRRPNRFVFDDVQPVTPPGAGFFGAPPPNGPSYASYSMAGGEFGGPPSTGPSQGGLWMLIGTAVAIMAVVGLVAVVALSAH
jgi:hypothetical protein